MLEKGYKREAKGMAVLRCFIGLFIVAAVVLVAYLTLRMDYSDKVAPGATMRAYVETTATPKPLATATPAPLSTASESPDVTNTPTPKPSPTAVPTPEPTATPAPTAIPESEISPLKFKKVKLPATGTLPAKLAITYSYRSAADNNRLLEVRGYAYIDDPRFDGAKATLYLVINQSTGKSALALPVMGEGISGVDHSGATCQNASACDFKAVIDVDKFANEIYSLGMWISCEVEGKTYDLYYPFPGDTTFTVLNKQVVSDLRLTTAE